MTNTTFNKLSWQKIQPVHGHGSHVPRDGLTMLYRLDEHTWHGVVVHVLDAEGKVRRGIANSIMVYAHHITIVVDVLGKVSEFSPMLVPFLYLMWRHVDIVSDDETAETPTFEELVKQTTPAARHLPPFRVDLAQLNALPGSIARELFDIMETTDAVRLHIGDDTTRDGGVGLLSRQFHATCPSLHWTHPTATVRRVKSHSWFGRRAHVLRTGGHLARVRVNELIFFPSALKIRISTAQGTRTKDVDPVFLVLLQLSWLNVDTVSDEEEGAGNDSDDASLCSLVLGDAVVERQLDCAQRSCFRHATTQIDMVLRLIDLLHLAD